MGPDDLVVSVARCVCVCVVCTLGHVDTLSSVVTMMFTVPWTGRLGAGSWLGQASSSTAWFRTSSGQIKAEGSLGLTRCNVSARLQQWLKFKALKCASHAQFVLQKTRVEPGRRPLSFLMPSVMVPVWNRCGTYMALSSSGGPKRLREITQVCCL